MKRSPYLTDFPVPHECTEKGCARYVSRVVIMIEPLEHDESVVTARFFCDVHADATHASFREAEGTA